MARTWIRLSLIAVIFALGCPLARAGQKEFQKLTVGYTPIAGAALPLFIAVEERIFQKYGYEIFPVFMGGSPLINSAILAGEFPIGYTGGRRNLDLRGFKIDGHKARGGGGALDVHPNDGGVGGVVIRIARISSEN